MDRKSKSLGRKAEGNSNPKAGSNPSGKAGQNHIVQGATGQAFGLQLILDSGESLPIASLPVSIGRSEHNDIVLKGDTVSATHARIYFDELVKSVCIVDMDSLNGLYIHDLPTHKNILCDGARIKLGKENLTFRDTGYIHPG